MTSLKDIASELGFSTALVSRVLSGRMGTTGCSEINRKAILAKAEELEYRPNLLAQALRHGRTGTLGVFIHPVGAPGAELIARLLTGLSSQANAHGQRLYLSFYRTDKEFQHHFAKTTRNDVDGLLIAGATHPEMMKLYKNIEQSGTPIVTIFEHLSDQGGDNNVFCDKFMLGYLPTHHLLEKGCRKIAHIRAQDHLYPNHLQALKEFALQENPDLFYNAPNCFDAQTGQKAVRHWIDNGIEFDGLVAESDDQAFGAIHELLARGYRVPEDVKVIGLDDSPLCNKSPIRISSISQQFEKIGAQAVNTLLQLIRKEPLSPVSIKPKLCLRASTAD